MTAGWKLTGCAGDTADGAGGDTPSGDRGAMVAPESAPVDFRTGADEHPASEARTRAASASRRPVLAALVEFMSSLSLPENPATQRKAGIGLNIRMRARKTGNGPNAAHFPKNVADLY
jgi:hypothetical protein